MALQDRQPETKTLPAKDYYTPGEIAKFFGVTARTVGNWCASGRLPFITTPSGHRRIPASAIKGGREAMSRWEALEERLSARTRGVPTPSDQEVADQVIARRRGGAGGAAKD